MNAIEATSSRRAAAGGRTLPQPLAYALSAAIIGTALFASATPSPLYETYARLWGFSSVVLTLVYATYAIGVLAALLLAGRVSDGAGRRPVLAIAMGGLLGATVLYMVAGSVAWLFAARAVQGLATGLALGTASAGLLDFHPRQDPEGVGLTNGVVSAAGLGFGALASSATVQLLPAPRVLPYVVVFILFAVEFVGVIFMPEPAASRSPLRLTPQRPHVPPSVRRPFIVAALAVISAYSIGGLFFALGPELSGRVFGTGNHLVTGLSLFLLAGVGAVSQLAYGRRAAWLGATVGSGALAAGMVLIVLAAAKDSAAALIIGSVVGGAGFGLAFLGSLRALSAQIPPTHRAGVMSAFFVAAYAALSIPAVFAGFAVNPLGLESTFEILGSAVAILALVVAVQAWRTRPRPEACSARLAAETRRASRRSRHFRRRRSPSAAVRGPGDLQPADRLLHIAHASGERIPNRYLCGAPVRRLIARIQPGTGPGGGGVCPTCAQLDAASAGGDARKAGDGEQRPYDSHDQRSAPRRSPPCGSVLDGMYLEQVAVIVDDYDAAIDFFVEKLGFELLEDSPALTTNDGRRKRWVVVRPPNAATALLLAQADGDTQTRAVGHQFAGRVGFFLRVDNFQTAYADMRERGVEFVTEPRDEQYGRVAVFRDVAGNRWDLLGPRPSEVAS